MSSPAINIILSSCSQHAVMTSCCGRPLVCQRKETGIVVIPNKAPYICIATAVNEQKGCSRIIFIHFYL